MFPAGVFMARRLGAEFGDVARVHGHQPASLGFGRSVGPHMRYGDLGVGQHERPPVGYTIFTPSTSTVGCPAARSTMPRITAPLRSHGVGTASWTTCVGGIAASVADNVRSADASRPRRCASVAAAS